MILLEDVGSKVDRLNEIVSCDIMVFDDK